MRAWELMKETLLRRRFILVVHLALLALYGVLFLPWLAELYAPWGNIMLFGSGCILPLMISAGIFGDDLASGRIAVLVTKPMRAIELYLWRLAGLLAQGAAHLLVAIALVVVLSHLTGRGRLDRAFTIPLAAFLLYCSTTALCVTISVVVKREFNSVIVFVGFIVICAILGALMNEYPDYGVTVWFYRCVKYGFPPMERIIEALKSESLLSQFLVALHALGLAAAYSGIGIFLLSRRQFPQARE
jgi:hypothetical protein